jgi:hypothetical protein
MELTNLSDGDLANLTKVAADLESKTKQMGQFQTIFESSRRNHEIMEKEGLATEGRSGPDNTIIQGPHDRLQRCLADESTQRAIQVSVAPPSAWSIDGGLPDDFTERVQRLREAEANARAKVEEIKTKYMSEVEGCGAAPDREITLKSMSLTGKVTQVRLLPNDSLETVKGKLQDATGIPPDQLSIFVQPRHKDLRSGKLVYAVQIKGCTDLIKHADLVWVWEKINATAGLSLWEPGDTAASFGLHDGAECFHILGFGGRSPLCTPAEQREQEAIAMAWMKRDIAEFKREHGITDDGAKGKGGGGPPGGSGCCAVQ